MDGVNVFTPLFGFRSFIGRAFHHIISSFYTLVVVVRYLRISRLYGANIRFTRSVGLVSACKEKLRFDFFITFESNYKSSSTSNNSFHLMHPKASDASRKKAIAPRRWRSCFSFRTARLAPRSGRYANDSCGRTLSIWTSMWLDNTHS